MIPDGGERFQLVSINNPARGDAENEQFDRQENSGPEGKPAADAPVLHFVSPIR